MNDQKRVVFPTDFSEASLQAFPHAVELSRRVDACLTVLYVHLPFTDDPYNEAVCADIASHVKGFVDGRFAELQAKVPEVTEISLEEVRNISAAAGILEYLEEVRADIVVLGTHGHSRIAQFLLGSVTEKVVRYSPAPVLTVGPTRDGYRDSPLYQRILVPYDFSEYARAAVEKGLRMARLYGAKMWIMYVIEQETSPGHIKSWKKHVTTVVPGLLEELKDSLNSELGLSGIKDVEIQVQVGHGDGKAHRSICSFIEETGIDLVVMGTYGLSGVEKVLLGTTTERVIRMAACPVMAFRMRDSE